MKSILAIVKQIVPKKMPTPVGRWRIEQCNTQLNTKIDLSNEDHCGPCGQYALSKVEIKDTVEKDGNNLPGPQLEK